MIQLNMMHQRELTMLEHDLLRTSVQFERDV